MKLNKGPNKGAPYLVNRGVQIIINNITEMLNTILSELSSIAQSERKISIAAFC